MSYYATSYSTVIADQSFKLVKSFFFYASRAHLQGSLHHVKHGVPSAPARSINPGYRLDTTECFCTKQMCTARLVAFDLASATPSLPLPSRSTVLRQSLLLAFSAPMTAAAAHGQTTSPAVVPSVKLRTGAQVPAVGLGVFLAR